MYCKTIMNYVGIQVKSHNLTIMPGQIYTLIRSDKT